MSYKLTQNVMAMSAGFSRTAGKHVGRTELPPALFEALLNDGVIVQLSSKAKPKPATKRKATRKKAADNA